MLHSIGKKSRPDTVTGRLLDCHDRIRSMTALACRLSAAEDPSESEIVEAAERIRRYFGESMPNHVRDEEDSILVRLRGRDASVDAALAKMHAQHDAHETDIAALIEICTTLTKAPSQHGGVRQAFVGIASSLERALGEHLDAEEADIIPALDRWLSDTEQAAIVDEMKRRRAT